MPNQPLRTAAILAIGDELITGRRVDTNSADLTRKLGHAGIETVLHTTVGDDLDLLARAFARSAQEADLVISTGGLGPTADDLTREALARAFDDTLVHDADAEAQIRAYFEGRGRVMPGTNLSQAQRPSRATILPNARGTAPGLSLQTPNGARVVCLPGPPVEMRGMYDASVVPLLPGASAPTALTVHTFGLGESAIAGKISHLMQRGRDPSVGTNASTGHVIVQIRSTAPDARARVDRDAQEIRELLGDAAIFAIEPTERPYAALILDELRTHRLTLSTAESCTGGLIGGSLTDIPGSSDVFLGGVVSYSNELKRDLLGVPEAMLQEYGAVSEPVARAMALGALERCGSDLAVSVTGIAGPEGGTDEKPVGTVWIGLARRGHQPVARHFRFLGGRDSIRWWTVHSALGVVVQSLRGAVIPAVGEVSPPRAEPAPGN